MSNEPGSGANVRVCIIGTGFGGLGTAIRLKQAGIDDFIILEKAADVGGCWRDNHYPGAACDVPSHVYSFSFAPKPDWQRSFATQPEIQSYLRDRAERYGIVPHIRFDHEATKLQWHQDEQRWHIDTTQGTIVAQAVVSAAGPLSTPQLPAIPGIKTFEGTLFHSARWDHDYDLTGRRVAVIGTGASSIQFVPAIQPQVDHLVVFQRTAPWIVPRVDRRITDLERSLFTKLPATQRLARTIDYAWRELNAASPGRCGTAAAAPRGISTPAAATSACGPASPSSSAPPAGASTRRTTTDTLTRPIPSRLHPYPTNGH